MLNLFCLILTVIFLEDLEAVPILEAKPELADVSRSILIDLSAVALGKAINEPSLVDVSITAIFSVLELENTAEAVEVLRVHQNLPLVNVVVVLTDADQLKL